MITGGAIEVGVISDTHGAIDPRAMVALEGVDYIVHAGDIGSPGVLLELESIAPVTAVLGNCDRPQFGAGVGFRAELDLGGVSLAVVHQPYALARPYADVNVCGHTHIPVIERIGGSLLVNPGSASRPRGGFGPTVALLTLIGGVVASARIVLLDDQR